MNWIEYKLPFIFSSSEAAGATNLNSNKSSFEVNLERPIIIPRESKNCYITVQNATAWWNVFNIQAGVNDQLAVEYFDGVLTVNHTLTLDPGLYDLDHLNTEIERELVGVLLPGNLFFFTPDQATQKVVIQFNYTGVQLDFSAVRNFSILLGFDERLVPLGGQTTTAPQYEKGDNIAEFNTVNYLLIHSDLVSRGIRVNDIYNNTIAQILIDQPPGSQLIETPFNPPEIPANELIGEKRRNLRFWITDDNYNDIDTQGEIFSVRLIIHYSLPIKA